MTHNLRRNKLFSSLYTLCQTHNPYMCFRGRWALQGQWTQHTWTNCAGLAVSTRMLISTGADTATALNCSNTKDTSLSTSVPYSSVLLKFICMNTGTLFYLATHITLRSSCVTPGQLEYAGIQGRRLLAWCAAVNIRFLFNVFKKSGRYVFFGLQTCITPKKQVHCISTFCKLHEPQEMASDSCQIMSLYMQTVKG